MKKNIKKERRADHTTIRREVERSQTGKHEKLNITINGSNPPIARVDEISIL